MYPYWNLEELEYWKIAVCASLAVWLPSLRQRDTRPAQRGMGDVREEKESPNPQYHYSGWGLFLTF